MAARSIRPALRSVRFSRIGLRAGCGRRFCQLVFPHSLRSSLLVCVRLCLSAFVALLVSVRYPLAAGRIVFPYSLRSSVRLVPRLVCPSRPGVSWIFFRFARRIVLRPAFPVLPGVSAPSVLLPPSRRASRSAARFSARLCRLVRASRPSSRQAVRIFSFRLAARVFVLWCRVVFPLSRSFLFSSHLSVASRGRDDGGGSSFFFISWRRALVPVASHHGIRLGSMAGGRYERAVFVSSIFPSGKGDGDDDMGKVVGAGGTQ